MEKVKIGFAGTGRMGQCAHLKNYVLLDECTVVAIAEPRKELAEKVARKYAIPKVYSNYTEMLSREKLDGIVASQPFSYHWKVVPEILKAGIPVFIEKPLACSVEQGEKIADAVKKSGTWIMVGYHKRNDPAVRYAKEQVEKWKSSGEMGGLRYVRISMNGNAWEVGGFDDLVRTDEKPPAREAEPVPSWMEPETYKKYLAFVNYYIHQINLLRHFLGEKYTVTYSDPQGILLVAVTESGKTGIIEMSAYSSSKVWHESVLIAMNRGFIKVDIPAPLAANRAGSVEVFSDVGGIAPEGFSLPVMPYVHAMRQQARNFVHSIRGEEKPMCGEDEALEDLKTANEYFKARKEI